MRRDARDNNAIGLTPLTKEKFMSLVQECPRTHVEPVVTPDFNAIKEKQQATWASGDFAVIGTTLQIVGESLAERHVREFVRSAVRSAWRSTG